MQIAKAAALSFALMTIGWLGTAFADVSERGVGTVNYSKKLSASDREAAIELAKRNAVERYFADTSPSRQQLFDRARQSVLGSVDLFLSNWVIVSEHQEASTRAFEIVVRADINETKLDLELAKFSPVLEHVGNDIYVAVVFVARTPAEIQKFDDRRYDRVDVSVSGNQNVEFSSAGKETEDVRSTSVATTDTYSADSEEKSRMSATIETGGSTLIKASTIKWSVAKVSDVDQTITGILTDRGMEVVPSEFIENLDLEAVRNDFGTNDDLAPQTLRALVSAVKANDISMLLLGTLDTELVDTDPISGLPRSHVMVNGRILDVSGKFPRVVSSIGPVQFSAIGSSETVAKTNAMISASTEAATRLVDDFAVRAGQ